MGKRSRKDPRHLARQWALGMLYALEFGKREVGFLFLRFPELIEDAYKNADAFELAKTYITELSARQGELDALIQNSSPRWKVGRMAYIDRNILRLATYELLHRKVPSRVVINEAVELAKRFGAEQTRNFVNGILQQICTDNAISL